jgi:hypothetical protein
MRRHFDAAFVTGCAMLTIQVDAFAGGSGMDIERRPGPLGFVRRGPGSIFLSVTANR